MAFPTNSDGKRIRDWRDLEEYGVHSLTGEACGIGIRLLCDLSPEGVALMEQFLSIKMTEQNNSWNHSGSAGWKSIMMPRGLFKELVVFCLMQKDGFRWAAVVDWYEEGLGHALYIEGFAEEENAIEFRAMANKIYGSYQWRMYHNGGTAGTRNLHHWTGRVA